MRASNWDGLCGACRGFMPQCERHKRKHESIPHVGARVFLQNRVEYRAIDQATFAAQKLNMLLADPVVERKIKTDLLSIDELSAESSQEQLLNDPLAFTITLLESAAQLVRKTRNAETQEWNADFN